MATPKLRLLKFESKTCPVCQQMEKKGTLDNLKSEWPNVEVLSFMVTDEQGGAPKGTAYEVAYNLSDEYEVEALPTLILINPEGIEVGRIEGMPSGSQLRKSIDAAIEEAEVIETQKTLNARVTDYKAKHLTK